MARDEDHPAHSVRASSQATGPGPRMRLRLRLLLGTLAGCAVVACLTLLRANLYEPLPPTSDGRAGGNETTVLDLASGDGLERRYNGHDRQLLVPMPSIRVFDAEDLAPLEGALLGIPTKPRQLDAFSERDVRVVGVADSDGRIAVDPVHFSGADVFLVARDGYMTRSAARAELQEAPGIAMEKGSTLHVQCVDLGGAAVPDVRVSLFRVPRSHPQQETFVPGLPGCEVLASRSTSVRGVATFTTHPGQSYFLRAQAPDGLALVRLPDDGVVHPSEDNEPQHNEIELTFAWLWAVVAVPLLANGRIITNSFGYKRPEAARGHLASRACHDYESALKARYPGALVHAAAGFEQSRGERRIAGRILLGTGWYTFKADYVRSDALQGPSSMDIIFETSVRWGDLVVEMVDDSGKAIDMGDLHLQVGGAIPSLVINGDGNEFRAPVGSYRVASFLHPIRWPQSVSTVTRTGGASYRRSFSANLQRIVWVKHDLAPAIFVFCAIFEA